MAGTGTGAREQFTYLAGLKEIELSVSWGQEPGQGECYLS